MPSVANHLSLIFKLYFNLHLVESKYNLLFLVTIISTWQVQTSTPVLIPALLNTSLEGEYRPFKGGLDIDGRELFICRTQYSGQVIPGKYSIGIGKCSIGRHRREVQLNQFEVLVENSNTKYEWVALRRPVSLLPENVLFGGTQIGRKIRSGSRTNRFSQVLSSEKLASNSKKRRVRRAIEMKWSRNWRGAITTHRGTRLRRAKLMLRLPSQSFTEVPVRWNCKRHASMLNQTIEHCSKHEESQRRHYFVAKCTLRTGDVTSEQIGKIWWKDNLGEWIASFPFGGHEIYCLDYSVLTVKSS